MGVPRFGELIRRRYNKCWFQEGKAKVFTNRPGQLDLSVGEYNKKRDVDTLYIDGNGLLHPAMQFTFAYGSFEDEKRQAENLSKTEDQLITEGTGYFLNAIESLCLEFRPQRLVVAIDGSAPVAKMVQQRQRRFGAKIDVSNDPSLTQAWENTLRRSVRNSLQDEGSFVSVTVEFDASRRDFGEGFVNTRLESLQPGSPQDQIFKSLIENLVKGKGQGEKLRWYNVLSPETPLGFKYGGKWWYSVAMAASALAWKEVWKQNTYVSMFGMDYEPELGMNRSNKFLYGVGKINVDEDMPVYRHLEDFRKFKINNSDFLIKYSRKVAEYCEKIGDQLVAEYPLYKETLLLTGVGTNLEKIDGKRIEWLMNVRTKLIQRFEKEVFEKEVGAKTLDQAEVDYPDYEGGFRGVEGVLHISKFDSNSLTPGTSVMNLIDKNIRQRIEDGKMKLQDGTYVDILYSSHRVPGEGEHKILNLIDRESRDMRGKVGLIYGLDADLFMLSLVRKYPLCLIRENSMKIDKFYGKIPSRVNQKVSSCHVVDIERLSQELSNEIETGKNINAQDFAFICFMFGNDFLRNVPGFVFDSNQQIVFDNTQNKNDSDINPVLFDHIFEIYWKVRGQFSAIETDKPLFIVPSSDIIRVRWHCVHEFIDELRKIEKSIYGGMIRKMMYEEEKERLMTEKLSDYVPVALRYNILKKAIVERQVIKGGVLDQKAEWVRGIDAFDIDEFRRLYTEHITMNIPGFEANGVVMGLTKDKSDVVSTMSQRYFEGMEWAIKYYTNRHSYVDKSGNRKSNLDTAWYYPYFYAPLISQLGSTLYKFIVEDSRKAFYVALKEKITDTEVLLNILFSHMKGKPITEAFKRDLGNKFERSIVDAIPYTYFSKGESLTQVVREQIEGYVREYERYLDVKFGKMDSVEYKYYDRVIKGKTYYGEYVFNSGWVSPRSLYGYDEEANLLVAPSSTNFKVQLLAVLPQQSAKYLPDGIQTTDNGISWMYPKGIPVDFTFRDRIHAALLLLPPPNIPYLESYVRTNKLVKAEQQIRKGMFPDSIQRPVINPAALKKNTYYDSFVHVLTDKDSVERHLGRASDIYALDVFGGVGISAMALSQVSYTVDVYESNRVNLEDMKYNVDEFNSRTPIKISPGYFNINEQEELKYNLICMDLEHESRKTSGRDRIIRVQLSEKDREGVPLEGVVEDFINKFRTSRTPKLTIVIKLPQFKSLGKIISPADVIVRTRFVKDEIYGNKFTYAFVNVSRKEERRGRELVKDYYEQAYDYYDNQPSRDRSPSPRRDYGYGRDRSPSPRRDYGYGRDRSPSPRRDYGYGRDRSPSPRRDYGYGRDRSPSPRRDYEYDRPY